MHPGSPPRHTAVLPQHPVHTSAAAYAFCTVTSPQLSVSPRVQLLGAPVIFKMQHRAEAQNLRIEDGERTLVCARGDDRPQCSSFPRSYCEGVQPQGNHHIAHPLTSSSPPMSLRWSCICFLKLAVPCELSRSRPFEVIGACPLVGRGTQCVCDSQDIFTLKGRAEECAACQQVHRTWRLFQIGN